jgi:hypothetical protein
MIKTLNAYVTKADGFEIRVIANSDEIKNKLESLGFLFSNDYQAHSIVVADNQEKAQIFEKLRDEDVYFSAGKEWSPAEVFEYLRDMDLLSGTYQRISWSSPDNWIKQEN